MTFGKDSYACTRLLLLYLAVFWRQHWCSLQDQPSCVYAGIKQRAGDKARIHRDADTGGRGEKSLPCACKDEFPVSNKHPNQPAHTQTHAMSALPSMDRTDRLPCSEPAHHPGAPQASGEPVPIPTGLQDGRPTQTFLRAICRAAFWAGHIHSILCQGTVCFCYLLCNKNISSCLS